MGTYLRKRYIDENGNVVDTGFVDHSLDVARESVSVVNNINSAIDTLSLGFNPGSLVVKGGEEIILTDDATFAQVPCMRFKDGAHILIPHSDLFNMDTFTVELLVRKAEHNGIYEGLLGKLDSTCGFGILSIDGDLRAMLRGDSEIDTQRIPFDLSPSEFTMVSAVFAPTYIKLYRNAAYKATIDGQVGVQYNSAALLIASRILGETAFTGDIAEVRLWNGERTPMQIAACKDKELLGTEQNLVGYWKLREGSEDEVGITGETQTLVVEGDFAQNNAKWWDADDADLHWKLEEGWSIADGKASKIATADPTSFAQDTCTFNRKKYQLAYTLEKSAGIGVAPRINGYPSDGSTLKTASGDYVDYIIAGQLGGLDFEGTADFVGSVSKITLKALSVLDSSMNDNPGLNYRGLRISDGPSLRGLRIFGGYITAPEEDGQKFMIGYQVECQDYACYLNKQMLENDYTTRKNPLNGEYLPYPSPRTMTLGKLVRNALSAVKNGVEEIAPGFTTTNVLGAMREIDNKVVDAVQWGYKFPLDALEELKNLTEYEWYVDYYKDVHFFKTETRRAPYAVINNPAEPFYKNLRFSRDRTQLRNRVYLKGGMEIIEPVVDLNALYKPVETVVGEGNSKLVYGLLHAPKELPPDFKVILNCTVGGVIAPKIYRVLDSSNYKILALVVNNDPTSPTYNEVISSLKVGLDNMHALGAEAHLMDALIGVDDVPKITLRTALNLTTQRLDLYYLYEISVLAVGEDPDSIALFKKIEGGSGVYEYLMEDTEIVTHDQAQIRAEKEAHLYGYPIVSGSFETHKPGFWAGQLLSVDATHDNGSQVKAEMVIQKVTIKSTGVGYDYSVEFSKFGTPRPGEVL